MKSFLLLLLLTLSPSLIAQTAKQSTVNSELCTQQNALHLVNEQIALAKTVDDPPQRIRLMLHGADLLWTYQPEKSRATFADAFELAKQTYDPQLDVPKRAGVGLLLETPDQRYIVIRAIGKRDPRWARKLADELLNAARDDASKSPAGADVNRDLRTAQRLLETAMSLLPTDTQAALSFADASLKFPADYYLTAFLYKLSEVDQTAADAFYRRALAAYAQKPLREFLYLASYPFGLGTTGDTPATGGYVLSTKFRPNGSLQILFGRTLAARAQGALESGADERDNYNGLSGVGHIVEAIGDIEPLLREQAPDLAAQLQRSRAQLLNTLDAGLQGILTRPELTRSEKPDIPMNPKTWDERIEAIETQPNIDRRDELFVSLVLNFGHAEPLDNVTRAASKINDLTIRSQVLDWFYFNRTQKALRERNFDEAASLASHVQELDQRAYLYSDVANQLTQQAQTQSAARTLLEQIVATAEKAPNTIITARAFLAAANLYLKFDADRAVAVLGQAIRSINQLDAPDFTQTWFIRRIEGKNFARYASYKTTNFDPEGAFREFAAVDVESAFAQSTTITDKTLRGQILLTMADFCLTRAKTTPKPNKPRPAVSN